MELIKIKRKESAKRKILKYKQDINQCMGDSISGFDTEDGVELFSLIMRVGNIRTNVLIKENPQEKNLIEKAAHELNSEWHEKF